VFINKLELTEILAKYYLGISQGIEIINWANEVLICESDFDEDFINDIAYLDKNDSWDVAKAEDVFFNYYNMTADEILVAIKRYFLKLLERITKNECHLYKLVDIVSRIKDKYQQPKWINDLFGFCVYLMPDDSTLIKGSNLEIEINKTICDLKRDLIDLK